jgi:hypothetical protein
MLITLDWLHANAARHSPYGSIFTKAQLNVLGLSHRNLKPGWMKELVGTELPDADVAQFLAAKNIVTKGTRKHHQRKATKLAYERHTPNLTADFQRSIQP